MISTKYNIVDAGVGLENSFRLPTNIIKTVTLAMDAVEAFGVLKGDAKKLAVLDMIRGIIENYEEISTLISHLIDTVKQIYNNVKELLNKAKEVFHK